jgi:hypothetical protein
MSLAERRQPTTDDAVERQVQEALNEVHNQSPEGPTYDRDEVRKIAEEFSRKYATLVRTGEVEEHQ